MSPGVPPPDASAAGRPDSALAGNGWAKGLEDTSDPKELIPGDYDTLLRFADELGKADPAFDSAGRTIHQLNLENWHGEAAADYARIARELRDSWNRQSDTARDAQQAIKIYANTGVIAQDQALAAAATWDNANKLSAEILDYHDRATLDRLESLRQDAQTQLDDARKTITEAEGQFQTKLDQLTWALPPPRTVFPNQMPPAPTPAPTQTPAPGAEPTPGPSRSPGTHPANSGTSSDGGSPGGSPGSMTPAPNPPTPTPTPTPTSPPVILAVPPTTSPTERDPSSTPDNGPHRVPIRIRPHLIPDTDGPHGDDRLDPEPRTEQPRPGPSHPDDRIPGAPTTPPAPPTTPPRTPDHPAPNHPAPNHPTPDHPGKHGLPADPTPPDQHHDTGPGTGNHPTPGAGHHPDAHPGTDTPTPPNAGGSGDQNGGGHGGLAAVIAAFGGAGAVGAGVVAVSKWMDGRRSYPIGSGRRDDYPPAPPVVGELPAGDPHSGGAAGAVTGRDVHQTPPAARHQPDITLNPAGRGAPAPAHAGPPPPAPHSHAGEAEPAGRAPRAAEVPVGEPTHEVYLWLDLAAAPGISILGNGASDLARAMICTIVQDDTAGPDETGGQVVITETDAGFLLDASRDESLPERLRIASDLDHALDLLHREIRERAGHPSSDPAPFVLVLAYPPADDEQRRDLAELLAAGHRYAVTAIILGDWPTADLLIVDHRHLVTTGSGDAVAHLVGRALLGLPLADARELLTTLAGFEQPAHTTTPSPAPTPDTDPEPSGGTHDLEATQEPPPASGDPSENSADPQADDHDHNEHRNPHRNAHQGEDDGEHGGEHEDEEQNGDDVATAAEPDRPPTVEPPPTGHARSSRPDTGAHALPATPALGNAPAGNADTVPLARPGTEPPPESSPVPPLFLGVLGRVHLHRPASDRPARPGELDLTAKLAELLAFLAHHREGVHRDTLVEMLWPDSPPNRPTNALHGVLNKLRQVLDNAPGEAIPNPIIAGKDGTYRLDPTLIQVDLWVFQDLLALRAHPDAAHRRNAYQNALALYRGEFAEGITKPVWIVIPRENIRRDALDTAADLARILTESNEHEQALAVLEKAKDYDPYNESVYQHIMDLQRHRLDRPEDATRTLKLLALKLADIGAEPSPESVALGNGQDPAPSPASQPRASRSPASAPARGPRRETSRDRRRPSRAPDRTRPRSG